MSRVWVFLSILIVNNGVLFAADSSKESQATDTYMLQVNTAQEHRLAKQAIESYQQALRLFEMRRLGSAEGAAKRSLRQYERNPFAHEVLGDIFYFDQKMEKARKHYTTAYGIHPTSRLKAKIKRFGEESRNEENLATDRMRHFTIKFDKEKTDYDEAELEERLRQAYETSSRDLKYHFHSRIVALLYDEKVFIEKVAKSHAIAGFYDGKVRMPVNRGGYTDVDLQALATHEVSHVFVADLSKRRAPLWLQEGLAEYQENKVKTADWAILQSAVKQNQLYPVEVLIRINNLWALQDWRLIILLYQQSHHLVEYLVERYGMSLMKEFIGQFALGRSSKKAIEHTFKISVSELERDWKVALSKTDFSETQPKKEKCPPFVPQSWCDAFAKSSELMVPQKSDEIEKVDKSEEAVENKKTEKKEPVVKDLPTLRLKTGGSIQGRITKDYGNYYLVEMSDGEVRLIDKNDIAEGN